MLLPKLLKALLYGGDVLLGAEKLEVIQLRYVALGGNDASGDAVSTSEVGIPLGNNAPDKGAVDWVIEEVDDLFGDCAFERAAAVGGNDEYVRV